MLQAPENYVLVEIEKKFQDETGGILIDPTWHPEEHATLEGTVVSAPARIGDTDEKVYGKVEIGDKIWFSFGVIFDYYNQPDEDTPIYKNLIVFEGKEYWKVDVIEIFCRVKDKVEMMTDNILLEPVGEVNIYDDSAREQGIVVGMPPKEISCKVGDKIGFESRYAQVYNILGKEHYIIPGRRAIAKWT